VNISIIADVNKGPIFREIQQALTIKIKINQANIQNPPNKMDRLMIPSLSLFIDDPPSWLSEVTKPLNFEKNATMGVRF